MKESLTSLEIDGRKLMPPEKTSATIVNRTIIMSNSPSIGPDDTQLGQSNRELQSSVS